ncbi:hypothetical protein Tco_0137391, partial [Tanacetum coccineum]
KDAATKIKVYKGQRLYWRPKDGCSATHEISVILPPGPH